MDRYPIPSSHLLRKGRYSQVGQIYLLTAVTRYRNPVFSVAGHARCVVTALRRAQHDGQASTIAFVVMPDHLHWLLRLDNGTLADLMNQVKGRSGYALFRNGVASGTIWQPGFHDHALRSDECQLAAARYIVANPLRAGLCARAADYPHWDAAWLYGREFLPD